MTQIRRISDAWRASTEWICSAVVKMALSLIKYASLTFVCLYSSVFQCAGRGQECGVGGKRASRKFERWFRYGSCTQGSFQQCYVSRFMLADLRNNGMIGSWNQTRSQQDPVGKIRLPGTQV